MIQKVFEQFFKLYVVGFKTTRRQGKKKRKENDLLMFGFVIVEALMHENMNSKRCMEV